MNPNCPIPSASCSIPAALADGHIGLAAERLNAGCFCISLDRDALRRSLESEMGDAGLVRLLEERCPYVFAARPVFVSSAHAKRMEEVVLAMEAVAASSAFRETVAARAPAIGLHSQNTRSAFMGYDFHVGQERIGLIEINTNAGGAMLNAVLARAQLTCCEAVADALPMRDDPATFEKAIVDMFESEWKLAGRTQPLRRIAIVDENPPAQYLYPEFLLFQRLFEKHGYEAVIAGPEELDFRDGRLMHDSGPVDLVYNRLTDFYLEAPASVALRKAYLADAAVLTPHPHAHSLYADKRNLALLSDPSFLDECGADAQTKDILLTHVPRTEIVSPGHAERLWQERKRLFFKPANGFGSRAAYRGDKLTKRVWQEILQGDYIAQEIIAPGERLIGQNEPQPLKFDIRSYVYDGKVQWTAARLYQGQTTNFRTPGGGFAPVYSLQEACC